ncbi:MAG: hypothetical protein KIT33_02030 [Candidatus Kapabacteria bacterium]|nr:hypothetical protein [Ignavibacteriota bacterium]MCW5883731.1 hypothetical protein [Candidatus Kapabacteria bacterium]
MKKFTALLLILSVFSITTVSVAQDYKWDPFMPIKGAFADVSVGSDGFGIGAGGRYMMFGLNLGLTGILNNSPTYALQYPPGVTINRNEPLPVGYTEEKFMSMMINVDAMFYFDFFETLSLNASVGFYSKNDSILAKNIDTGSRYIYRNEPQSGLCFGVGAEYVLQDNLNVGAGFHTQRGAVIRLTYLWF